MSEQARVLLICCLLDFVTLVRLFSVSQCHKYILSVLCHKYVLYLYFRTRACGHP